MYAPASLRSDAVVRSLLCDKRRGAWRSPLLQCVVKRGRSEKRDRAIGRSRTLSAHDTVRVIMAM